MKKIVRDKTKLTKVLKKQAIGTVAVIMSAAFVVPAMAQPVYADEALTGEAATQVVVENADVEIAEASSDILLDNAESDALAVEGVEDINAVDAAAAETAEIEDATSEEVAEDAASVEVAKDVTAAAEEAVTEAADTQEEAAVSENTAEPEEIETEETAALETTVALEEQAVQEPANAMNKLKADAKVKVQEGPQVDDLELFKNHELTIPVGEEFILPSTSQGANIIYYDISNPIPDDPDNDFNKYFILNSTDYVIGGKKYTSYDRIYAFKAGDIIMGMQFAAIGDNGEHDYNYAFNLKVHFVDDRPEFPLVSIALNKAALTLKEGQSENLKVSFSPEKTTDSKDVKWTSSNRAVAAVNANGRVTANKAGTAIIAADCNGKVAKCKVTVNAALKDGIHKVNGVWKYLKNGKFEKVTGIAQRITDGKWLYVENGVFKQTTGVAKRITDGKWMFVRNGVFTQSTGVAKRITDGQWVFVKNGIFTKATGVAKRGADGKWMYVKNGIFTKITGIAKRGADNKWVYVKNGVLTRATGVAKRVTDGKWLFVRNGVFTQSTGVAKRLTDNKWVFVKNGVFTKATGIAKRGADGKWMYVKDGIFTKATGLARRGADGKWLYVKNGVFTKATGVTPLIGNGALFYVKNGVYTQATGLAKHLTDGRWLYVENGAFKAGVKGLVPMVSDGKFYFVNNGVYQKLTGVAVKYKYDGKVYVVKNGALVKAYSGQKAAKFVNTSASYKELNNFRTTKSNQWYWNSDNSTKTYVYGLKGVKQDPLLEQAAKVRAREAWIQYFVYGEATHMRLDGSSPFTAVPAGANPAGENLAWDYGSYNAVNVISGANGWAETNEKFEGQGHRRNMLAGYITKVGIACYEKDGMKCWAMVTGY